MPYAKLWEGGVDYNGRSEQLRVKRNVSRKNKYFDYFPLETVDDLEFKFLKGRYLYGGPFFNHFGHFMTDSIIRLYAYDPSIHAGVIFPCVLKRFNGAIPGFVYEVLELFGVSKDAARFICEPTKVDVLDSVERSSCLLMEDYEDWYYEYLNILKSSLVLKKSASTLLSNKNLYLGRVHLIEDGSLLGESYIAEFLDDQGFEYFVPENYSVVDQACALMEADVVIFLEGSSIYSSELVDNISASCFMISRRKNGLSTFKRNLKKFKEI